MRRAYKKITLQNGQFRHLVTLTDDPTDPSGVDLAARQFVFLRMLAEQPDILVCGPVRWQKLRIWHSGAEWMCEAEAVEETAQG